MFTHTQKAEETPNSVLASNRVDESSHEAAQGRRDAASQLKSKRSFKGVANLVIAMRRFQGTLQNARLLVIEHNSFALHDF